MEFHSPHENVLLAALPARDLNYLLPHLELTEFTMGQVLSEAGETPHSAYFPTTCVVSLVSILEDGHSTEISVVGNEGVVGISLFMGGENIPSRAVVQSDGLAYRLHSRYLKEEFAHHGALTRLMLRYTQVLLTHVAQTAACNRHHSIDQQFCRWLLLSLDRLRNNQLKMTQEQIADALGVRRESITDAALKLQKIGVIEYARGHITVCNRLKLEQLSCECYALIKKETDRLLPFKSLQFLYAKSASASN